MKQLFFGLLTILFFSCKESTQQEMVNEQKGIDQISYEATDSVSDIKQQPKTKQDNDKIVQTSKIEWDKKIVKTAYLNAEIKDYKNFSAKLYEKAKQFGGYVSNESQHSSEYKIENTVTIKVPVDQFDAAVNTLLSDAIKVDEKRITSEDVTTEYVDGKSRLEAKKQVRQRYLELLTGAKNMSDILEVQSHINSIQEDIETVNGRLNYLSNVSALSSIQLTYYQVLNPAAIKEDSENFFGKLKSAFAGGWFWIGELFIGLISIWPLLLMGIVGYYIFKKRFTTKAINKSA